jgi:hypothetical protein
MMEEENSTVIEHRCSLARQHELYVGCPKVYLSTFKVEGVQRVCATLIMVSDGIVAKSRMALSIISYLGGRRPGLILVMDIKTIKERDNLVSFTIILRFDQPTSNVFTFCVVVMVHRFGFGR